MKEQIISLIKEKDELIGSIRNEVVLLKKDLISEYGLSIGDTVNFDGNDETYFIYEIELWAYKPRYNLTLPKKDGSMPSKPIRPKYFINREDLIKI
jgi:hypothetical protein